jgi:hypothetical protein
MRPSNLQKRSIRKSATYITVFEDMVEAGILEKEVVEELLVFGPGGAPKPKKEEPKPEPKKEGDYKK